MSKNKNLPKRPPKNPKGYKVEQRAENKRARVAFIEAVLRLPEPPCPRP